MPRKVQNVQQNFAAGVLSPRYSIRVDSELYDRALSEGKNWIISTQGGIVMREGLEFIGYPAGDGPFRLFQYLRGGEISDVLVEVSEGVIRFWVDGGRGVPHLYADRVTLLLDEADDANLIDEETGDYLSIGVITGSNPYSVDDLDTLYFTNQDKYGILCSGSHAPIYMTFKKNGELLVEPIPLERIPLFDYNDTTSPKQSSELSTWRLSFPTGWLTSNFIYYPTYNNVYPDNFAGWSQTAETNRASLESLLGDSIAAQGLATTVAVTIVDGDIGSYDVTFSGEDAGGDLDLYLSAGINGGVSTTGYTPIQMPPLSQSSDSDVGVERAWSYPQWVLHNSRYWECIQVHRSSPETEPNVGADFGIYWRYIGPEKPAGFDYQFPDGNNWAVDHGIYAPMGRGFPTVCTFHEQRLWLMANKDNPTALYGSGIGQYQNYLVGPNDDEAIIFVLDSQDTPEIKWAVSSKNLLLGTSSGDWLITAQVTITPTDISAERQNAARSKLARPVQVDTEIIYLEQGGRKARVTQWDDGRSNSFTSADLSALAEHLVATEGVKRVIVQTIPETLITILRENGQPIFLTYDRAQQTLAFSEMETDASVYDFAAYFSAGLNREHSYYATQRNNRWVIERMRYPCSKVCEPLTENNIVMLDGWVTRTPENGALTGLAHLERKTVGVLHGDAWVGEFEVVGGQISLPEPYDATYAIGQVYRAVGSPFPPAENFRGTGLGTKRRWNRLTTRLLNSALPKIYGQRSEDRTPSTAMDTAETIRPGIQDITQNVMGWTDGTIIFEQDRPYPTHIIGWFGEYDVEQRK